MKKGIVGKKIGMTQIFTEDGRLIPVTVIEAGPCPVVQKKTMEKDGYEAIQVGFDAYAENRAEKLVNKPLKGHFAKANVARAGLSDTVRVFEADARTIRAEGRRGTIVTNPPYGERLLTRDEAERLYRELGEHFRSLAPWQVYIITSDPSFERFYGKRADRVRKLYNGMIPAYLYQFFVNKSK